MDWEGLEVVRVAPETGPAEEMSAGSFLSSSTICGVIGMSCLGVFEFVST